MNQKRHTFESNFCLKPCYRSRATPVYHDESGGTPDDAVVYQPEVYEVARRAARHFRSSAVIDIGCGSARKLISFHPEFAIVGVDFGQNIAACREKYPFGTWIEADLESANSLLLSQDILENSVVVCSDVIEHLKDPTCLLQLISSLLDRASVALISTPERNLKNGLQDYGPPSNTHHVREWTLDELRRLAIRSGLEIAYAGLTTTHNLSSARNTILLVARSSDASMLPPALLPPRVARLRYWWRVLRKSFGVMRNE